MTNEIKQSQALQKGDIEISLIVPVYNSVQSLSELAARIEKVFAVQIEDDYELIFVDDGSSNAETWLMLQSLAEQYDKIRALQLTRNFGRIGAVMAGITSAKGAWLIIMDDDLQHCPEDIPRLLSMRQHDVVLAQFDNKKHGVIAKLGSRIVTWLKHEMGFPSHLSSSSFLLVRAEIARHILQIKTPRPFLMALLLEITRDIVGVETTHDPRPSGGPVFTFGRRLQQFTNLLINNSTLLLQSVAILGIAVAGLSFASGCYLLINSIIKSSSVPGWISSMIVSLMIGGLILMLLGVVGMYLVRIIRGVEAWPAFVLRREIGHDKTKESPPEEIAKN